MHIYFKRLLVLFCVLALMACSTKRIVVDATPGQGASTTWIEQLAVGDRLVVTLQGEKEPLKGKYLGVEGDLGFEGRSLKLEPPKQQNGQSAPEMSVALKDIQKVERKHYSWLKNSLLVTTILLLVAANSVKNSLDKMDLGCFAPCMGPPPSNAPSQ
jgi:hypothetical protein